MRCDTFRLRKLKAEAVRAAQRAAIAREKEPFRINESGEYLILAAPQWGWLSPQKSDEDLALILSWVDVRVSDDEIAKQLNEIVTSDIDRMALSGWDFDQTSSVSLASGAAKEDGHWASVERRAVSPQGNEIRRDDLPHVVTVTVSTYPGSGMLSEQVIVSVWVFSDGHFEFHAPDIQELPECADELWNTVSEADRRSISVSHKLNQPRSAVNV